MGCLSVAMLKHMKLIYLEQHQQSHIVSSGQLPVEESQQRFAASVSDTSALDPVKAGRCASKPMSCRRATKALPALLADKLQIITHRGL